MFRKRQTIPILFLFLAVLACNTLFPDLPQNTVPDPVRKDGECTDQRFKDAELAAFQTMLQERKAATDAFDQQITEIEKNYKERLLKQRTDYNNALNSCKDAACSAGAKADYDTYVTREQVDHEAKIQIAEDAEQTAIEQAQDNYNAAVEEARRKYCTKAYEVTGQIADAQFSGVICSLEQPFTIDVTTPFVNYPLEFTPSSSTGGSYSFQWTQGIVNASGSGTYTVAGLETDSPQLSVSGDSTGTIPVGSVSGAGAVVLNLSPLGTGACQ